MDLPTGTDRSGAEPAPRMPSVADYWPDRPGAPASQPTGPRHSAGPPQGQVPEAGPGRGRAKLGGAVVLALLAVVGVVLATFVKQANSQPSTFVAASPAPEASIASPVPTGPVSIAPAPKSTPPLPASPVTPARRPADAATTPAPKLPAAASFEVAATAGSVTVRTQDLGTDLYRVALAKHAGRVIAKISDAGPNHRLTLAKARETVAPPITITLNSGVRWSLKLTAGNSRTTVNLTRSKLASLELAGGADVFNLALPPAIGTLPLRVTRGMNQLKVDTNGFPVRTTLRAGAGKVILDGETHEGAGSGQVFTTDGWSDAANRVDLDSVQGLGTLTVDTD